ncbi:hypothetical protein J6590_047652 [Homalodisca vitripennis]|nr:hypothetical protein J6590_047652 [Homalodisca vitripennis]
MSVLTRVNGKQFQQNMDIRNCGDSFLSATCPNHRNYTVHLAILTARRNKVGQQSLAKINTELWELWRRSYTTLLTGTEARSHVVPIIALLSHVPPTHCRTIGSMQIVRSRGMKTHLLRISQIEGLLLGWSTLWIFRTTRFITSSVVATTSTAALKVELSQYSFTVNLSIG